jgi:hypothetical protein
VDWINRGAIRENLGGVSRLFPKKNTARRHVVYFDYTGTAAAAANQIINIFLPLKNKFIVSLLI